MNKVGELNKPFYDPEKNYKDNFTQGPFNSFGNGVRYKNKGEPRNSFLGNKIYLPFGIPAGPLLNSRFIKFAFEKGFDICTYKTVRSRKYPCNQWPNILAVKVVGDLTIEKARKGVIADNNYNEPLSITNSFGVPSYSPDFWQEDMEKAVQSAGKGQVMIGSFQGTPKGDGDVQAYIDDYILTARLVKETGALVLEANLSCPNEGKADLLCFDVQTVQKIAEGIKNKIGNTPLLLKLAYFETDNLLRRFVKAVGLIVDGLVAINTIPANILDKNGKQALPGEGRMRSGVCGRAVQWAGLDMVKRLRELRQELNLNYSIIGVGGVTKPEDYKKYRQAAADVVMSATGAMWNPYLAEEIKKNYL